MKNEEKIALICNGPSAENNTTATRTFRVNHWYLSGGRCDDWFIGEHPEIVHAVAAYNYGRQYKPAIWFPGLSGDAIERNQKVLTGCAINVQKHYQH